MSWLSMADACSYSCILINWDLLERGIFRHHIQHCSMGSACTRNRAFLVVTPQLWKDAHLALSLQLILKHVKTPLCKEFIGTQRRNILQYIAPVVQPWEVQGQGPAWEPQKLLSCELFKTLAKDFYGMPVLTHSAILTFNKWCWRQQLCNLKTGGMGPTICSKA